MFIPTHKELAILNALVFTSSLFSLTNMYMYMYTLQMHMYMHAV